MTDDGLIHPLPFQPKPLGTSREPRARRRLPLVALLGVLVLIVTAGLLVAARAVEVQVEPAPDRLSVRGGLSLRVGSLRLLLPGHYTVAAEKTGYRPMEAPLEVTSYPRQIARFALEPLPGLLTLEVAPPGGVRVTLDGEERGTTPLAPLEVGAGEHEVVLRAEGYATLTIRTTVSGLGQTQSLQATLKPDRASVSVSSDPAGASVRVDGAAIGTTPLTADLTSGARLVEVGLPGFRTAARRIEVHAEQPLTVPPFRLERLPGRLQIKSVPPSAAVMVDGQFRGETPLELDLPAGPTHTVRATKAGHDTAEDRVTLEPGRTSSLDFVLAPQIGEVEVVGEPKDAEVLVDGESRGRLGQTLRLTAAPHALEIRRPGYEPHRVTVTPKPGLPQSVRVRLDSEKEKQAAARPAVLRTPAGHELRLLSGGRFQLGASRREAGRRANETLREVELERPFYLAVREVTNAQFKHFKPDHSSGRFGAHDLGGEALPVVQVTWEDAASYCNWLSAQEGLPPAYAARDGRTVSVQPLRTGYRLPTEAEWSRAARYPGEGPLKYPWGNSLPAPPRAGNFADESARALVAVVLQGYDDRYPATAPVGSFPPSPLGFFDLGGNVAEWVHDVYAIPSADGPVELDPLGPPPGDLHVILGSSFLQGSVSELRLSYRDYATKPRVDVGFRIARYAE